MHQIAREVVIAIPPVFGVDLSITNEVLLLWTAAAITFVVLTLACRRRSGCLARGPFQNTIEAIVEFIDSQVIQSSVGEEGRHWSPFLMTLFFFILFCNLLGLVPLPDHFKAITSNVNVSGALAISVFVIMLSVNLRRHGPWGFLKKFKPGGVPLWLSVVVIPIEIVSWLLKPISLAIRLFANMLAGHAVIFVFLGMAVSAAALLKWLPVLGAVAMEAFELFVCFVQAFIFALLAGVYIREAMEDGH